MTAQIEKIEFCSLDGDPTILVHYKDGRILGFAKQNGKWVDASAPEIATSAALLTKEQFDQHFGNVGLPAFPD